MSKRTSIPGPGSGPSRPSRRQKRSPLSSGGKSLGSAEVSSPDFAIWWEALPSKKPGGGFSGFSISVSQRIRKKNKQEMWDSVVIKCEDSPDGGLLVQVFVSDPEWEAPMQIAALRSRPDDLSSFTPMGCNLDHVQSANA